MSLINGGWDEYYKYERAYIVRQSYFVFIFPLFVVAGMEVYSSLRVQIYNTFKRYGLGIFITILLLDIGTAMLLGELSFREENGYEYYLDKGLIWLFVCFVYFQGVASYNNKKSYFILLNLFFIIEIFLGYGVMFNAMTGVVLYLLMFTFYFTSLTKGMRKYSLFIYFSIVVILFMFVLVAPFFKEFFEGDLNTFWRLSSWENNLLAVFSNYSFGVGFGVAYFPNSPEALDAAFRSYIKEGSSYGMYDSLFVRGQHSSIINVFFRLGVLGGVLLISIFTTILLYAKKYFKCNEVFFLTPIFIGGLLNISVHVGFESPPFLMTISLAIGFLISAICRARSR
jgi:hypothetical protein